MRVAIYTRVSTSEQSRNGYSLDNQLQRLKEYCKAREWKVVGIYTDGGNTGRNTKRKAYQQMFQDIDKWEAILVLKMDRIHRNSKNFMLMMEYLKKEKKEFVSMNETLDTSNAMGRFVMNIIQGIAQLESEVIGERVKENMLHKFQTEGGVMGFPIPYGYDYIDKELIINEKQAVIVKKIFKDYLKINNIKKIANQLNRKEIPTKHNGKWNATTISRVLKNPIYCGYLEWDKQIQKGNHKPIIDGKIYNETQAILSSNGGKVLTFIPNV